MAAKVWSLVQGKEICNSLESLDSSEMYDNLVNRFRDRVCKEIVVFGKGPASYVIDKLLDLGITDALFETGSDGNSFKVFRREISESEEIEIEGVYIIE